MALIKSHRLYQHGAIIPAGNEFRAQRRSAQFAPSLISQALALIQYL